MINKQWAFWMMALVCLATPAYADNSAKSGEGISVPVHYEVKADAKTLKANKGLVATIEAADAYKQAECSANKKAKGIVVFTCQKPSSDTDALFRSVVNSGASVKLVPMKQKTSVKALNAAAVCPTGCNWGTSCNPAGACCKISQPWIKCAI